MFDFKNHPFVKIEPKFYKEHLQNYIKKMNESEKPNENEILKDSIISELTRDDTDLFNTDEEMVVKVFEILSKRATVLV